MPWPDFLYFFFREKIKPELSTRRRSSVVRGCVGVSCLTTSRDSDARDELRGCSEREFATVACASECVNLPLFSQQKKRNRVIFAWTDTRTHYTPMFFLALEKGC